MNQITNGQFRALVLVATLLTSVVTIFDIYVSKFDINQQYIVTRIGFIVFPFTLVFFKTKLENKILLTLINYSLYTGFYSITLDNTYFFTMFQLLLISLFFFYTNHKYFQTAFWFIFILSYLGLFFSNESSIIKDGESLIPDLSIVGFIFSSLIFLIKQKVSIQQTLELEKISQLAGVGIRSSYFLHEIKGEVSGDSFFENAFSSFFEGSSPSYPVNITKAVTETIEEVTPYLKRKDIALSHILQGTPTTQLGDFQFRVILNNLIRNAIEHMTEYNIKGTIEILTSETEIKVSNPVIDKVNTDETLLLFHTTKIGPTNKGLGVNIIKDFLKEHNLELRLYSTPSLFTASIKLE